MNVMQIIGNIGGIMKKTAIFMMCCALLCGTFSACSDNSGSTTITRGTASSSAASSKKSGSSAASSSSEPDEKSDPHDNLDIDINEKEIQTFNEPEKHDELYGIWRLYDFPGIDGFYFDGNGKAGIILAYTDMLNFKGSSFVYDGDDIPEKDVAFDGRTMSVNYEGKELITMIRTTPEKSNYVAGKYLVVGGSIYDDLHKVYSDSAILYALDYNDSFIIVTDLIDYTINDNRLVLKFGSDYKNELKGTEYDDVIGADEGMKFKISGDSLSLWFSKDYGVMLFKYNI